MSDRYAWNDGEDISDEDDLNDDDLDDEEMGEDEPPTTGPARDGGRRINTGGQKPVYVTFTVAPEYAHKGPGSDDLPGSKAKRKAAPESDVGYGKPPKEHRFQKGESGNPKGRPLGSKNKPKPQPFGDRFGTIVLQEFYREVTLPVQGAPMTLTMAEVGMRGLMARAAKGSVPAMRLATELASRVEAEREKQQWDNFCELVTLKFENERELERRKQQGLTDQPPVVPHPDDIVVDVRRVTAEVNGPLTEEEKEIWDAQVATKKVLEDGLAAARSVLATSKSSQQRRALRELITTSEAQLAELLQVMPDWKVRE